MARRRSTASRSIVRYSAPPQRTQTIVVAQPRRSIARRAGGYLRSRGAGAFTSSRLRRGAGLVTGGGVAQLLVPAAAGILGDAQRGALAAGLLGYVIGGTPDFLGAVGDGLLAAAGGAAAGDALARLLGILGPRPGSAATTTTP